MRSLPFEGRFEGAGAAFRVASVDGEGTSGRVATPTRLFESDDEARSVVATASAYCTFAMSQTSAVANASVRL